MITWQVPLIDRETASYAETPSRVTLIETLKHYTLDVARRAVWAFSGSALGYCAGAVAIGALLATRRGGWVGAGGAV